MHAHQGKRQHGRICNFSQACRQGGGGGGGSFEGVRSNPLFGLQKILYTPQIYISALLFASGLLILLLLRITSVQASLVAVLWLAEQQVGCNC